MYMIIQSYNKVNGENAIPPITDALIFLECHKLLYEIQLKWA